MNNLNEEFNKLLKDHGGIFDREHHAKIFQNDDQLLASRKENIHGFLIKVADRYNTPFGELKNYHIGIVNNSDVNAYAFGGKDSQNRFIGLNYGLILKLYSYFLTLLSAADFFKNLGDAQIEKYTLAQVKEPLFRTLIDHKFEGNIPKCPVRKDFAYYLWILSTDFVCYHEVGHHIFGHVNYLNSTYHLNGVDELFAFSNRMKAVDHSVLQALELDADDVGAHLSVLKFSEVFKKLKLETFGFDYMEFLIIAIAFTYQIFDELRINKSLDKSQTHPHPTIRFLYILGNLVVYHQQLENVQIKDKYKTLINTLEETFLKITRFSFRQNYRSPNVHEELFRLSGILTVLKKTALLQYSQHTHFTLYTE